MIKRLAEWGVDTVFGLPGKVTYDQAKKFAEAWLHGRPDKASIASTLFRDRIQQLRG